MCKNATKTQKTLAKNENFNMFENLTFKKETKAKGQNQPHTICFRILKKSGNIKIRLKETCYPLSL